MKNYNLSQENFINNGLDLFELYVGTDNSIGD